MQKTLPAFLALVAMGVVACKKDAAPPVSVFETDRREVTLRGELHAMDSIVVTATTPWTLSLASGLDWVEADVTSGTGNAVIHFKNLKENSSTVEEVKATLIPDDKSIAAIDISLRRRPYFIAGPTHLFGGKYFEQFHCSVATADGGYVMAGFATSADGDLAGEPAAQDGDGLVVKYSSAGVVEWRKVFHGESEDVFHSISKTADGGYVMAGRSNSKTGYFADQHGEADYWVVKISSTGNQEWSKVFGGSHRDEASQVIGNADGSIFVSGITNSFDKDVVGSRANGFYSDIWVLMLDNTGKLVLQKPLGGSSYELNGGAVATPDGNFLLAGHTASTDGDFSGATAKVDGYLMKIKPNGDIVWTQKYGGTIEDILNDVIVTADGGYLASGWSMSRDGQANTTGSLHNCWAIKVDADGKFEWSVANGGGQEDMLNAAVNTPDGGYLLAGDTKSTNGDMAERTTTGEEGWLIKVNKNGTIAWRKPIGGTNVDFVTTMLVTTNKKFVIGGWSQSSNDEFSSNHGYFDGWVSMFE